MKFSILFFTIFLLIPSAFVNAAGVFQDCGVGGSLGSLASQAASYIPFTDLGNKDATSYACDSELNCADVKDFGMSIGTPTPLDKACLPHKDYATCGKAGNCGKKTDGNIYCSTVVSLSDPTKFDLACLSKLETPFDDNPADGCKVTADCTVGTGNRQCVEVVVRDKTGKDSFIGTKRCVDVEKLPAKVLDADKGSCGKNAVCSLTQSCVTNTYEPQTYVCYENNLISKDTTCPKVADACTINGKAGTCMVVLETGKKIQRCIDPIYIPNGPNAPSSQLCNDDSNCKSQPGAKYCIMNPTTQKKQCFSQQTIFTDMSQLPKQLCGGKDCTCTFPGVKNCDTSQTESICAPYVTKPGVSVCINFVGDGAALGTGAGTADENPGHLATVAEQSYEMYAPKLQIDIPNLTFIDKINAVDGPNGVKRFSVPYLSNYINAVYKYAIGLGVLIAIVVAMYGGMRWMTSFGSMKAVEEAKTSVRNAMLGLFLLMSSYTILYVINPELPKMKALQILAPKQETFWVTETGNDEVTDGEPGEVFTPAEITPGKLPAFKQCDPKWANAPYPGPQLNAMICSNGKPATVCNNGCAVTALAAVLVFHGYSVTPADTAKFAAQAGGHLSCGGSIAQKICDNVNKTYPKVTCRPISGKDTATIAKKLQENKPVIFSCHGCVGTTVNGKSKSYKGHYMVATGISADGNSFTVLDVGNKGADRNVSLMHMKEFLGGRIANAYVIEGVK